MDAENNNYTSKVGDIKQNGFLKENHSKVVIEEVNGTSEGNMLNAGPDASMHTIGESTVNRVVEPSILEVEGLTGVNVEANGSLPSEKLNMKESKEPKAQKIQGKGKREKPSNITNASRDSIKNTDNTMEHKGTSNGTLAAITRPKQPVMKTKSFNNRHATNIDLNKGTKLAPSTSIIRKAKPPKSEITSSSGFLVKSDVNIEKSLLNLTPKAPTSENGDGESVGSAKSHKLGKLPAYDFSFRCHERAEKRKEFYTKLEQRVHAQEIEKYNQQAKSKESQEAEIKMLRKSLNFKAAPMPSFSPPPKVELKKTPITRPKSPKLGRKKNSISIEEDGDQAPRAVRLSLDEKVVSRLTLGRGTGSTQSKQPQRKSLPRLPSEKTCVSKIGPDVGPPSQLQDPIAHIEDEVSVPCSEELVPIARPDEEEVQISNLGSMPITHVEEEDPIADPNFSHYASDNGSFVVDGSHTRLGQRQIALEN